MSNALPKKDGENL